MIFPCLTSCDSFLMIRLGGHCGMAISLKATNVTASSCSALNWKSLSREGKLLLKLEGPLRFSVKPEEGCGNNRSVMPLDVLGRTRATLTKSASISYAERCGESCETLSCWGLIFEILDHKRGIPSKRKSSTCTDYVPALCTHRPSLLPIEWSGEQF